MIHFFPTPQLDEAYFSLFTRYHLLSGNSSYQESARILFNGHQREAFDVIPRSLPSFARQIHELHDITPHDLVEKFTVLPFLRLFFGPERYRRITSFLFAEDDHGYMISGKQRPHLSNYGSNCVRYCPTCAEIDIRTLGFSYWRRSHQLPGVTVCHIHETPLTVSTVPSREHFGHNALPLSSGCNDHCTVDPSEIRYAKWCNNILEAGFPPHGHYRLADVYQYALDCKGHGGRNYFSASRDLIRHFGQDFLRKSFPELTSMFEVSHVVKRLTLKNKICDMRYHVLLISFLFDTVDSLTSTMQYTAKTNIVVDNSKLTLSSQYIRSKVIKLISSGTSPWKMSKRLGVHRNISRLLFVRTMTAANNVYKQMLRSRYRKQLLHRINDDSCRTSRDTRLPHAGHEPTQWLLKHDRAWLEAVISVVKNVQTLLQMQPVHT